MDLVRSELVLSTRTLTAPVKGKDRVGLGSDPIGECKYMLKTTKKSLLCPFFSLLQCLILCSHLWGGKQMTRDRNRTLIPNRVSLQTLHRQLFAN